MKYKQSISYDFMYCCFMIDLEALVSLRAVDTHGSVVGAAGALGYTPSAVSQQVKRLERQAGVALLERVGRGVMLTEQGRHLVDHGSRLLTDLEAIEAGLHRSAHTVAGTIRLAAFSTAMRGLVARALPSLLAAHPELRVRLSEHEPWDTIDLVAAGHCEVGLVHRWGTTPLAIPEHVEADIVGHDVADVLVPTGHRLACRSRVSPKDLVDEAWIATPEGTICREWLQRMHDGLPHPPRIAHQSVEFESHVALVAAGLGIALVPRLGRGALPEGAVAVAVHDPVPTREITALRRRSMRDSPAAPLSTRSHVRG
jgi:DNA-binding transcriptional LysR family regulator